MPKSILLIISILIIKSHYSKSQNLLDTTKIVNDRIYNSLLSKNLELSYAKKNLFLESKTFKENIYDLKKKDTYYTFRKGESILKFIKSGYNNELLLSATIMASDLKLNDAVYVGMSKSNLCKLFKKTALSNIITLSNYEESGIFIMYSNGKTIIKIDFETLYLE